MSETSKPVLHDAENCRRKLAESERIIGEMVEELSSCYESLSAIFRYSAEQTRISDLKAFSQRLLTDLLQIIGADWFVLRLVPPGRDHLAVFAASEPAPELAPLKIPASPQSAAAVEAEAGAAQREVWFDLLHRSILPTRCPP